MNAQLNLHDAARRGYQAAPAAYERGRPDYPDAAVARLTQVLRIQAGDRVLEVGAGTGKLTRRLKPLGIRLLAVEPVPKMRALFRELVPEIPVVAGYAEALPCPTGSVDQVVCAQAFHWFDGPAALKEIRRVLKPGGHLGLIWNVRDESVPWVANLTRIMDPYSEGVPRYRDGNWRRAFDASDGFTSLEREELPNRQRCDLETILDRVGSVSFIAALAPHIRKQVLKRTRRLLEMDPETAGRAEVDFPYRCDLYWCRRY